MFKFPSWATIHKIARNPYVARPAIAGASAAAILPVAVAAMDSFHRTDALSIPGIAVGVGGAAFSLGLASLFVKGVFSKEDFFGYNFGHIIASLLPLPLAGAFVVSGSVLHFAGRLFAEHHPELMGALHSITG